MDSTNVERIIAQVVRMNDETATVRGQGAPIKARARPNRLVRKCNCFGMQADREDMHGLSSRKWPQKIRGRQWTRPRANRCTK